MCPLHMIPPKEWADHLSHPYSPTLRSALPQPHIRNQLAPLREWVSKETSCLLSLPSATGASIKPCLNFLSGLLSTSIDITKGPWTQVSNSNIHKYNVLGYIKFLSVDIKLPEDFLSWKHFVLFLHMVPICSVVSVQIQSLVFLLKYNNLGKKWTNYV